MNPIIVLQPPLSIPILIFFGLIEHLELKGGFGWTVGYGAERSTYFLSQATISNLTATVIFTLTAFHPN